MFRFLILFLFAGVAHAAPLTLAEATRAALDRDPVLQQLAARGTALREDAAADGSLPDPELMGGIGELPLDGIGVASGEMRMYEVGIAQRFPPRGTRRNLAERGERLAAAEHLLVDDRRLAVAQAVTDEWLQLLHLHAAIEVLRATRTDFETLVETVESRYAQGVGRRDDVVQVQLELARIDEQESVLRRQLGAVRAALARRVGPEYAARSLDRTDPVLPEPADAAQLRAGLDGHPRMRAYAARVDAGRFDEAAERGMYRPEFGVSVAYMRRTGRFAGMEMPDAVAARASISLPLFTANRQDRRLAAARARTWEADAARLSERYELEYMLERALSDLAELRAQAELYSRRLLPAVTEYAETVASAYRAGEADLTTVVRARIAQHEAWLEHHDLTLQLQRVRAELQYLSGDEA